MPRQGLGWSRAKPGLAGVMESRCRPHRLSGSGLLGKARSEAVPGGFVVGEHPWKLERRGGRQNPQEAGRKQREKGNRERRAQKDGDEAPGQGTGSSTKEADGAALSLLGAKISEIKQSFHALPSFLSKNDEFPPNPRAKLLPHKARVANRALRRQILI